MNVLGSIGDVPLPVEYVSFEVENIQAGNLLRWETAEELNNKGFYVERSGEGVSWNELDFIQGENNHSGLTQYNFLDKNPLVGENYYRLRQVDIDGSITYSDIVNTFFASGVEISVFPNPVKNLLELSGIEGENVQLLVLDRFGRQVMEINTNESKLDVSKLASGIYFLKVRTPVRTVSKRFVKE